MKPSTLSILWISLVALIPHLAAQDASPSLEQLLQDALFAEEATQDLDQAAISYEKLLEAYRSQRQFAATALFRLAEVRRKQERPEEAAKLYQQLLAEFPQHDPLARLSRENLIALGETIPTAESALGLLDEEGQEIERLRKIITDSPDLLSARGEEGLAPIHQAAKEGHGRVVRFLLENKVDVNHEVGGQTPLSLAARYGHKGMCQLLVANEADIERGSPLGEAIVSGYGNVGEFLLEKGASPSASSDLKAHWLLPNSKREGSISMLNLAIYRRGHPFVEMLLERGADPDLEGAIFEAIASANEASFDRLLERGVDVNLQREDLLDRTPPLSEAIREKNLTFAKRLLTIADVSLTDKHGNTALHEATRWELRDLVGPLVDRGAVVDARNESGQTPLFWAIVNGNWESAQQLIALGADPEVVVDGKPLIKHARPGMRVHLMRVHYPEWSQRKAITLSLPEVLYQTPIVTSGDAPPSLADALLSWTGEAVGAVPNQAIDWTQAQIFRQAPKEIIEVVFASSGEFPALEWGDVIEFTSAGWDMADRENVSMSTRAAHRHERMDDRLRKLLDTRRRFSVQLVAGDVTQDLVLRGDLRSYDPTKQEAPLLPLDGLAILLGFREGTAMAVERPREDARFEVVLGSDQDKLELEEGDVIRLDATTEAVAHLRPREITLYSPGLLYGGNKPILEAGEAPTLLQFLAWQYRPMLNDELKALESNQSSSSAHLWSPDEVSQALSKRTDVGPFAVLPYPDWARVEIRRLREDGTEEVIPVNLRAAIDACTEETLLEEARAVDRPLQWGDQVALPVMEPKGDAPWNGFTPETIRFFSKALQREVIFQEASALVRSITVRYVPTRYIATANGLIPVPSEALERGKVAAPWADELARSVAGSSELVDYVERGGERIPSPSWNWLKDGDRVVTGLQTDAINRLPPQDRRRVILPPAPRQD